MQARDYVTKLLQHYVKWPALRLFSGCGSQARAPRPMAPQLAVLE